MAEMTKEDLKNLVNDTVKDVVGEELDDLKKKNQSRLMEMFQEKAEIAKEKSEGKGNKAARYLRALAAGKGDPRRAADYVEKNWGDKEFSKELLESDYEGGGVLVPDEYVSEVIELLRAESTVRQMGAQQVPMNSGSMTMPKLNQGATSQYVGESSQADSSQQKFGSIQLSAKKLMTLVPISNDLLRDSSPQVDAIVRDDLTQAMALREDIAFIRDDGSENKPQGMLYQASSDNKFARTDDSGSITLDTVTNDLVKAMYKLDGKNVPMTQPGWIFPPRVLYFLMKIRDGNGNYAFRDELQNGNLMGFPYATTTQIPTNLDESGDGDNDETEIYFSDFNQLIIGENTNLIIDVSTEGTYTDGSGNQISAFGNDLTIMRAIAKHDFGVRHDDAIAVVQQVDWKF